MAGLLSTFVVTLTNALIFNSFYSLLSGLKFMMFKSTFLCDGDNKGCELSTGGRCSVCAVVFWFLASCMAGAHTKERMDAAENEGGGGEGGGQQEDA